MRFCVSIITLFLVPAFCADRTILFNRDVRPILSDKCYGCHGPDAVAKKIPLRLDSEAAAKADLGGGRHAIVDGDPAPSQLVQRITAENKAMRMPPVYSGLKLSDEEIETLRLWIAQGAKWQKHWSFIPPERPPLPAVKNAAWPRNPIDSFVLARLEREGLTPVARGRPRNAAPPRHARSDRPAADARPRSTPSSPTSRRTPTRRSSIACSPRRATASAWPSAGSTRARYADTNGYQTDGERVMWRWRDWVIDAFNRNMPFDQFTIEQLAGDLLPNATLDAEDRHRLQSQPSRQRRGRHHSRGVRGRVRRRPRRDDVHRLARPDARLRALPRPQVRSDHAEGVLPALRLLQQRAGEGPGHQVRQLAAADPGADARAAARAR